MAWITERFLPTDPRKAEARGARIKQAHERLVRQAEHDPSSAHKLRRKLQRELSSFRSIVDRRHSQHKDMPAELWPDLEKIQQGTQAELDALERRMSARGWLDRDTANRPVEPVYSLDTLVDDLGASMVGAGIIGLIAAVPIGLWLIVSLYQLATHAPEAPPVIDLIGMPLTVAAGYLIAAGGTGFSIFLLRPLRRSFIGWPVSGAFIAAAIYGGVGLAGTLAYVWFDINLLDFDKGDNPWTALFGITGLMAVLGIPAGIYWWWKEDDAP